MALSYGCCAVLVNICEDLVPHASYRVRSHEHAYKVCHGSAAVHRPPLLYTVATYQRVDSNGRSPTTKHAPSQAKTHLFIPTSAPSPACSCPPRNPHGNLHRVGRRNPTPCCRCCCCCKGANCPRQTRDESLSLRPALLVLPAADTLLRCDSARGWRALALKKESAGDCIITAAAATTPTPLRAWRPMGLPAQCTRTGGTPGAVCTFIDANATEKSVVSGGRPGSHRGCRLEQKLLSGSLCSQGSVQIAGGGCRLPVKRLGFLPAPCLIHSSWYVFADFVP